MNTYCQSVFNQMNVLIKTVLTIIDKIEESDLEKRPTENKHSIGELLKHIALICEADLFIADEKTSDEMNEYYSNKVIGSKDEMKEELISNYNLLKERYKAYTDKELFQKKTAYWGVTYTRYEWLLEILAHLSHHRGQLHAILVHSYKQDPNIHLFE
ncbi:damage-inducible protein DinB [Bacillus sp. SA1-12]|uniref:DinB family protein n=1 Tax=Bacillus sp. SA1-12 TaxID=1455638 RepID=UPI000626F2D9|nr:DinB family protein [Bacillus sp. SA1-12]KKI91232.1 damage-inducible protein DinB [Bacillus sp. SA1-12]